MSRNTVIINISAPPKLAKKVEKQAKKEGKTKSKMVRDAIELYMFRKKMEGFQSVGKDLAEKLGLETYDDIEEYFG